VKCGLELSAKKKEKKCHQRTDEHGEEFVLN